MRDEESDKDDRQRLRSIFFHDPLSIAAVIFALLWLFLTFQPAPCTGGWIEYGQDGIGIQHCPKNR